MANAYQNVVGITGMCTVLRTSAEPIKFNFSKLLRERFAALLLSTFVILLASCGDDSSDSSEPHEPEFETRTLNVSPIAQQTEVWCWSATAEMVLRHFGLPNLNPGNNYQCGIVAVYFGPTSACWFDCYSCITAIGSMSELQRLVNGYGQIANQFTPSRVLTSKLIFSSLSFNNIAREIDNDRPIIAGISPSGYSYPNISQHVAVIVGYETINGTQNVIVNDPFPYDTISTVPNPFYGAGGIKTAPGRYFISYSDFVSKLQWSNTIYRIK